MTHNTHSVDQEESPAITENSPLKIQRSRYFAGFRLILLLSNRVTYRIALIVSFTKKQQESNDCYIHNCCCFHLTT